MRPLYFLLFLCGLILVGGVPLVHAQAGPEKGVRELEIWTAGGYGVKGIDLHTGIWSAGLRYGWVLTNPCGPGFLKGRLEYSVELAPVFVVFQAANTAYGVELSPLNVKWNFDTHRPLVPYADIGAGSVFTDQQIPAGVSRANFATSAALGVQLVGNKFTWSADVRFMHISDSGLTSANPGINVVQLRLSVGLFKRKRY